MKLVVSKNHLGSQIFYSTLDPSKKRQKYIRSKKSMFCQTIEIFVKNSKSLKNRILTQKIWNFSKIEFWPKKSEISQKLNFDPKNLKFLKNRILKSKEICITLTIQFVPRTAGFWHSKYLTKKFDTRKFLILHNI